MDIYHYTSEANSTAQGFVVAANAEQTEIYFGGDPGDATVMIDLNRDELRSLYGKLAWAVREMKVQIELEKHYQEEADA